MPKRRRNSLSLTKAERRLEGLRAVNPALNFGNVCQYPLTAR
jgi:hypothetical protein